MSALLPSEVLSRAADLIEPEGAWTQGTAARDAEGRPVGLSGAVCWCVLGALTHVGSRCDDDEFVYRALPKGMGIAEFNDFPGRTQAEVVAALRKASELAKAAGQ